MTFETYTVADEQTCTTCEATNTVSVSVAVAPGVAGWTCPDCGHAQEAH